MSSEIDPDFVTVLCDEYCLRVADGTHGSPKQTAVGKLLVTSKNVKDGRLLLDSAYLISEEDYVEINRRSKVDQWDLLLTMIGTVGEICIVEQASPLFAIKNVGLLKCGSELRAKWLYYFLRSPQGQQLIEQRKKGSTQQYISLTEIRNFPVSYPTNETDMRGAVSVLSALDDRITLLRETNTTLEAIAQALFKSWFVDFDPVRAKAEGLEPQAMDAPTAALFPDSFEESELGLVPKGWRVLPLGDICSVTIGGLWGNDDAEDSDVVPAISLRGVDLEQLRANGFSKDAPVRWVKQAAMEKRRLSGTEVLVAASGAGPCGRPLWAGAPFEVIYGRPVIFSNFVKRLECGTVVRAIYVDRLLAEMRKSAEIWNFINGTSVPNLDDKLLLATKRIVLPSDEVLSAFFDIAKCIYDRLYDQKAQTLTQLRDTLLPRLISGQLRLPEAEAEIEGICP